MPKNKYFSRLVAVAVVTLGVAACPAFAAKASGKQAPASAKFEAPMPGVITVSDYEFNTFAFASPVKRILFPSGSPVLGKPIYLSDNTQVMLQFVKGSDTPIQMVAELEGSPAVTLRVLPRAIPGVVHAVNGARARRPASAAESSGPPSAASEPTAPRGEDVELLKYLVTHHEPPSGFDLVKLPAAVRFDKFSVVPLAAWSDGASKRVMIFSLVAVPGQTAVVAPPQFYRPGITAVMLDGDAVDASASPQLFVVEELSDE